MTVLCYLDICYERISGIIRVLPRKKGQQIIIHHKILNYGCIHVLFIVILVPTIIISFFVFAFSIILIPLVFFYFMEVDKRKKHDKNTILDLNEGIIIVEKKKNDQRYPFQEVTSVIATSEHIGGYASADRNTTEEYRREINILFSDGEILTLFSFVSDNENKEEEVQVLISWLEGLFKL